MKTNWNWRRSLVAMLPALLVGLSLLPAGSAVAYEDEGAPDGEWRVPGTDVPDPGGDSRGTGTPPGGLNADPDTFEIDSWDRGGIRPVDTPAGAPTPGPVNGLWTRILAWLYAILADAGEIPAPNGR